MSDVMITTAADNPAPATVPSNCRIALRFFYIHEPTGLQACPKIEAGFKHAPTTEQVIAAERHWVEKITAIAEEEGGEWRPMTPPEISEYLAEEEEE